MRSLIVSKFRSAFAGFADDGVTHGSASWQDHAKTTVALPAG